MYYSSHHMKHRTWTRYQMLEVLFAESKSIEQMSMRAFPFMVIHERGENSNHIFPTFLPSVNVIVIINDARSSCYSSWFDPRIWCWTTSFLSTFKNVSFVDVCFLFFHFYFCLSSLLLIFYPILVVSPYNGFDNVFAVEQTPYNWMENLLVASQVSSLLHHLF